MRVVSRGRRREPAAIRSRNFLGTVSSHDFFDKIDVTLQIGAKARNLPFRYFGRADFLQTESGQNFVDRFRFDRDPNNAITFLVA